MRPGSCLCLETDKRLVIENPDLGHPAQHEGGTEERARRAREIYNLLLLNIASSCAFFKALIYLPSHFKA